MFNIENGRGKEKGRAVGIFSFAIWVSCFVFLRFNSFVAMLQPFYRLFFLRNVLCVHWNSIWLSLKYHFTLFGVTVLLNDQTKQCIYIYSLTLISRWYVLGFILYRFSIHISFLMYELCVHTCSVSFPLFVHFSWWMNRYMVSWLAGWLAD